MWLYFHCLELPEAVDCLLQSVLLEMRFWTVGLLYELTELARFYEEERVGRWSRERFISEKCC